MKRVAWKLPFIHQVFFKKRILLKSKLPLRLRNSLIPSSFVTKRLSIHNGIWYLSADVNSSMVGFKIGQFSFTRRCEAGLHSIEKRQRRKKAEKARRKAALENKIEDNRSEV